MIDAFSSQTSGRINQPSRRAGARILEKEPTEQIHGLSKALSGRMEFLIEPQQPVGVVLYDRHAVVLTQLDQPLTLLHRQADPERIVGVQESRREASVLAPSTSAASRASTHQPGLEV